MVIRHDGQSRSTCESVFLDPSPDGFCHAAKLGVRTALNLIVALEFERDVVRPSLLTLEKAIVEGGHGRGEYTRKPFLPPCAVWLRSEGTVVGHLDNQYLARRVS